MGGPMPRRPSVGFRRLFEEVAFTGCVSRIDQLSNDTIGPMVFCQNDKALFHGNCIHANVCDT